MFESIASWFQTTFSPALTNVYLLGILETLYMTLASTLIAYIIGLPLGIVLYITDKDGITPNAPVNKVLGVIINILRSVPFLILLVVVIPFTRIIVGTSIGSVATIVPLSIAAFPFVARMVESSVKEIDHGVIEAAQSMGTPTFKLITKVIIPEAMPSLLVGLAISVTTILGYTATAGVCGGGGLGAIAINYGYYRSDRNIMYVAVVLLVIIVQVFQTVGMKFATSSDKRLKNKTK